MSKNKLSLIIITTIFTAIIISQFKLLKFITKMILGVAGLPITIAIT